MDPAELEGAPHFHRHPSSLFFCQPFSVLDMNLTQIAGENINAASTIAKALEEHIQKVIPS